MPKKTVYSATLWANWGVLLQGTFLRCVQATILVSKEHQNGATFEDLKHSNNSKKHRMVTILMVDVTVDIQRLIYSKDG